MNTSMPSPASDLAALIAGGTKTPSHSQLKGMFAGLTNSRNAPAQSGSSSRPDFKAMLDAPATAHQAQLGAAGRSAVALGRYQADDPSAEVDAGRAILTADLSSVATSSLQIKGISAGVGDPASLTEVIATSTTSGLAPTMDDAGEKPADPSVTSLVLPDPATLSTGSDAAKIATGGAIISAPAVMPGRFSSRQTKPRSGLENSLCNSGGNQTANRQSVTTGKVSKTDKVVPNTTKSDASSTNDAVANLTMPLSAIVIPTIALVNPEAALAANFNLGKDGQPQKEAVQNPKESSGEIAPADNVNPAMPKVILSTPVASVLPSVAITDISTPAVPTTSFTLPEVPQAPSVANANGSGQQNATPIPVGSVAEVPSIPDVAPITTIPTAILTGLVNNVISVDANADVPAATAQPAGIDFTDATAAPVIGTIPTIPTTILAAQPDNVIPVFATAAGSVTLGQAANLAPSDSMSEAISAVAVTDNSASTGQATDITPANTGQSVSTSVLSPAQALRTQFVLNQADGSNIAQPDGVMPTVAKTQSVAETTPISPEVSATTPITPELRRDVVETVAAMLAPFLMSLPVVLPQSSPVASGNVQASEATTTESGIQPSSPLVTISLGTQTPFSFSIPSLPATNPQLLSNSTLEPIAGDASGADTLPATSVDQANPAIPASDGLAALGLFAGLSSPVASALAGNLPLDFRIQLKTTIETAWKQADQTNTTADIATTALASVNKVETMSDGAQVVSVSNPTPVVGTPTAPQPTQSSDLVDQLSAQAAQPAEQVPTVEAAAVPQGMTPIEVMVQIPGYGSVTAQIVAAGMTSALQDKKSGERPGQAEKTAGDFKPVGMKGKSQKDSSEKTFLNVGGDALKVDAKSTGTDVAISGDSMPANFTSRRVTVDQLEFPPKITGRDILPSFNEAQNTAATNEAPVVATPAPVLAHRAVETIQNVVDAQRNGSANASSVNLHFKFGGDDLAVRVQMRGGEVLTQFLTDSADLRSAITSEWQRMAGQGGVSGLRMLDPVILPSSAGTSSGFGSSSQGQNQAQQNAQQQQSQAAEAMPEWRALRRGASVVAPTTEAAPSNPVVPSTSHRLTAMA